MSSVNVSPDVAIEDDDADHAGEADEEVVLAALVVVEPPDDALARARQVRLRDRLRQRARARELREPAAVVLVPRELEPPQPLDHWFTPERRTKSFTS